MVRPRKNPGASGIQTRDLLLSRRTPQPLGQRGGLGEIASLICCSFYLSVATCKIVSARPCLRGTASCIHETTTTDIHASSTRAMTNRKKERKNERKKKKKYKKTKNCFKSIRRWWRGRRRAREKQTDRQAGRQQTDKQKEKRTKRPHVTDIIVCKSEVLLGVAHF